MNGNGKPLTEMTQNPDTLGEASPLTAKQAQDRVKLLDVLADWIFLFPLAEDAGVAAKGELLLRCDSYDYADVARVIFDQNIIIVCGEDPAGTAAAVELGASLKRRRAGSIRIWPLAGLGTKYHSFSAWHEVNRFELLVAIERPWLKHKGDPEPAEPAPDQESHSQILIRLASKAELFHTPDGEFFATITVDGHREHHPIESDQVEDWLFDLFHAETAKVPSKEALKGAVQLLRAHARKSSPEHPVSLRMASDPAMPDYDPAYYVDLGRDDRQAVKVTIDHWELVRDPPVRFRRPKGTGALPVPERGGSMDDLFTFVNVLSDEDRLLVIASITASFLPRGPYPVQVITGEQGSAKSTTTKLLKYCIDPRTPMLGACPKEMRDLMINAKNTWVLALDNLSSIPVWLSDGLARLATGGGFSIRKNYSDDEEMLFDACRPIVLNSIEEIASRADLLDRAVVITCPRIRESERRQEAEFWRSFDRMHPKILGAILDAIAGGLAMLPVITIKQAPRMADFAKWGEAVCQYLGYGQGAFLDAYAGNRDAAAAAILEDSPIAAELATFRVPGDTWTGTCQELLTILKERAGQESKESPRWPKTPRSMSCHLRRLAPALRKVGIDVDFPPNRSAQTRPIFISWTPPPRPKGEKFASRPSSASSAPVEPAPDHLTQTIPGNEVPF
jgi:hypothetical protein